jgi:hypothetical protein
LVDIAVRHWYKLLLDIAHHVQDWDAIVAGYIHRDLEVKDELPVNPYIDVHPEVPGAVGPGGQVDIWP